MKANELRIGNLTKQGKVIFIELDELIGDSFRVEDSDGVQYKNTWMKIQPIPLTPEILEKAGFEKTYNSPYRVKFDHIKHREIGYTFSDIKDYYENGFRFYDRNIDINYLHQLQNLYFALTGDELPIEL